MLLTTHDGEFHGPDVGSEEWMGVVEFRLGLRDDPELAARGGEDWCGEIDRRLRERGPSYPCEGIEPGSVEDLVCEDLVLLALDRRLAEVYAAAMEKAAGEARALLRTEQHGWIKGRDDCWKSESLRLCVEEEYRSRIAELQARFELVRAGDPVLFDCGEGEPIVVRHFSTEPPTLIATRGDESSLMFRVPSASGARYRGGNESLWENQGEAIVVWGFDAPERKCRVRVESGD